MRIDIYLHQGDGHSDVARIIGKLDLMSAALDRITADVAATKTVAGSAIALLNQLTALIVSLRDDPVALAKLADDLESGNADLQAAITANTPPTP